MSWYQRTIHFLVAVALAAAVCNIWMILRVKQGAVESFPQTMIVAALLGIGVPLATTMTYAYWRRKAPGRMYVFHGTCALLAIALGLVTF